jgi:hypothetical protein
LDTVKFQHHAIGIPEITPADRIIEAAKQLESAIRALPKDATMDTLEAIQNLREIMLGKRPNDTQLQRVRAARPQRVQAAATVPTRTLYTIDHNVKAFLTTKTGGPSWNKVTRRVTLSLNSGDILEDLVVNKTTPEKLLHRMLPKGTPGTCTILYHGNGSMTNMDVPAIQPQRVAAKPTADATDDAPEPNYVSDDEDDVEPTRRRRSPRLNKLADAERPDIVGNESHRIVALVATEKAEIPRLVIQQHKLARGYGAANLELQLREWGYKDHSDWAEANNFAVAIVCPKQANARVQRLNKSPRVEANADGILGQQIRKAGPGHS